ncbi:hypothetical protein PO909_020598 [Leuciscus waleckii]
MCVDLTLFPLDTIKTRLQSQQGFYKAGGFRGIYAGVPSAAVGSFPNAAAFFVTYESTKSFFAGYTATSLTPFTHMLAASLGEIDDLWKIVPDACCNSNFLKHCWEACAPSSWTVWNVPAVSIDVWNHRCEIDLGLFYANGNLLCWDLKNGLRFVAGLTVNLTSLIVAPHACSVSVIQKRLLLSSVSLGV